MRERGRKRISFSDVFERGERRDPSLIKNLPGVVLLRSRVARVNKQGFQLAELMLVWQPNSYWFKPVI